MNSWPSAFFARRAFTKADEENLASYLGVLHHADAWELRQELITKVLFDTEKYFSDYLEQ